MSWLPAFLVGLISILLSVIYLQIASANIVEETAQLEESTDAIILVYLRVEGRRQMS